MVYYTFSQGFRPGGFNQNGGSCHASGPDGVAQYCDSAVVLLRQADQQRDRLEDGILRPSPAVERRRVPRELGQRPGRVLRPRRGRQLFYDTNGQNFLIKGIETSLVARVMTGLTLQGCGILEPERADQFARADRQQPRERELRQADHRGLQHYRHRLRADRQSVRPDRRAERRCAADSVQRARPLRVEHQRLHAVRAGRLHPQRPFIHAGGIESHLRAGRDRHDLQGAVRDSRLLDRYDASLGVAKDAWWVNVYGENLANSNASTFISTDQFIVAADAASAAGHRRLVRLQILRTRAA